MFYPSKLFICTMLQWWHHLVFTQAMPSLIAVLEEPFIAIITFYRLVSQMNSIYMPFQMSPKKLMTKWTRAEVLTYVT